MLAARPNLNGNSAEDFRRAGLRLLAAREAAAAALGAVQQHQQYEEQAGDDQQDLQREDHSGSLPGLPGT